MQLNPSITQLGVNLIAH